MVAPKLEVTVPPARRTGPWPTAWRAALHMADANLYIAKNSGRNRCVATAT
ncbi:PleD family two-component response regulator [Rhizobium leguminosarum]|nr:PleD family two-component response regulator [Rhizobium leguminosarum]